MKNSLLILLIGASSIFASSIDGMYLQKANNGNIVVQQIAKDKVKLKIQSASQTGHICDFDDVATLVGNKAVYREKSENRNDELFEMDVVFYKDKAVVSSGGAQNPYCGMRAVIDGIYTKKARK